MTQPEPTTLDLLCLLRDEGFPIADETTWTTRHDPDTYAKLTERSYGIADHVALWKRIGSLERGPSLSRIGIVRPVTLRRLLPWLRSFPGTTPGVAYVSGQDVFLDGGSTLLILSHKGQHTADKSVKGFLYNTWLYGTPALLLQHEAWWRKAPKPMRKKKDVPKVGFLVRENGILQIKDVDLPNVGPDLDLDLLYGPGMTSWHATLVGRLSAGRSGLTILHGPPGGGKTTYIRHLARVLRKKKKLILMPKAIIEVIGTPEFVNFLISLHDTPSILVVEDAEDVVDAGARSQGSATSTLLNLTDGILNDVAATQVVVTFNCPVSKVDPALLRNGRLTGKREFGPLPAIDARRLAESKGLDPTGISGPTMLCDVLCSPPVANPRQAQVQRKIGFAS